MRVFAAIALAVAAVALVASASMSGAKAAESIDVMPHMTHPTRLAPSARKTKKATGLNCVAKCSAYESTINQYFTDVAADNGKLTNVYSVATQYENIEYAQTFDAGTNSYVDPTPYPSTKNCKDNYDTYCVTDHQLQTEIGKVIAAHEWPTESPADSPTAVYFIFTPANVGVCQSAGSASASNACTTNVFCAYHSNTNSFIYAVEPDAAAISDGACDPAQHPAGNGADATLNTVSHEQNEAITDPDIQNPADGGLYSDDAQHEYPEMADLCAYDFGAPEGTDGAKYNQTLNGHNYLLQLEYSNADGGCVPNLGGPVTPQEDTADFGVGPVVYHGGSVMTTNTVYAIYWVPAKPANSKLPTISGTTKVGKTLKAGNGAWSYGPKFTYRWLRCSSAGKSCKGIKAATARTYTLVDADAHHRIEVRVTATNMTGHVSATSAPTATIKN